MVDQSTELLASLHNKDYHSDNWKYSTEIRAINSLPFEIYWDWKPENVQLLQESKSSTDDFCYWKVFFHRI